MLNHLFVRLQNKPRMWVNSLGSWAKLRDSQQPNWMWDIVIWSGYGGWLFGLDLLMRPCHSLGWVKHGKKQAGKRCKFCFGHVDSEYLWDIQEGQLSLETQISDTS